MRIRRYDPSDLRMLNEWLTSHEALTMTHEEVPALGFIVSNDECDLAAGFLRVVEGGTALIDSLVSNPEAALFSRHLAIEALVDRILNEAKKKRFAQVLAYTVDPGVLKRASKRGFTKLPHTMVALNLNEIRGVK